MSFLYSIFYSTPVNFLVRNILFPFRAVLPVFLQIPIRGKFKFKISGQKIEIDSNESSHLTKFLFWNDSSKFEYTPLFSELILDSKCFLDVGSNFGYYSLIGAKLNSNCDVHAFEPSKGPLWFLKRNIKLNNLQDDIHVVDKAVSDSSMILTFTEYRHPKYKYLEKQISALGNLGTKEVQMPSDKYNVETVSLDSYCTSMKINPDLIKIDTEGNETSVFKGAVRIIESNTPIIITEILESLDTTFIEEIASKHKYTIFNITRNNFTEIQSFSDLRGKKLDIMLVPEKRRKEFNRN